jgi:hypothetical protein
MSELEYECFYYVHLFATALNIHLKSESGFDSDTSNLEDKTLCSILDILFRLASLVC